MNTKYIKNKVRGFTLVELLVVIAILAILVVIAIPRFLLIRTSPGDGSVRQTEPCWYARFYMRGR